MKVTKLFCTLLLTLLFSISYGQETITNKSVIQMKELGFDDNMIIDKINTSNVKFDASIDALGKLKNAGVSSEIISLVMQKSKQNTKSKTGIYYVSDDGNSTLIQPTVFSGTSNDNAANRLVSGFIPSVKKARLSGARSNNVIKDGNPEFTFTFDPSTTEVDNLQTGQGSSNGAFDWWFRTASSPNEFVLAKLDVNEKRNLREVITGKSSIINDNQGIDPKYAINFEIETIEGNVFKVTPKGLAPGEYAFIYQGAVPSGRTNQSVFDFSVQ